MRIKNLLWIYIAVQFFSIAVMAQEKDISSYLKAIDAGRAAEVKKQIPALLKKNPNDASLLYLDAAVTPDGERAADKYTSLLQRYPKCKYADAAMYRLYGYYCARGMDKKANQIMADIKQKFPKSKYLKQTDNVAPAVAKSEAPVTKAPEKQKPAASITPGKSKFTIQIGAFLSEANAKSLRDRVAKDDIVVNVKAKDIGGSMFYIVYAGGYSDEKTAQKAIPNFNSQYSVKGRVVPVP
jgi:cell division septation protein DedD